MNTIFIILGGIVLGMILLGLLSEMVRAIRVALAENHGDETTVKRLTLGYDECLCIAYSMGYSKEQFDYILARLQRYNQFALPYDAIIKIQNIEEE